MNYAHDVSSEIGTTMPIIYGNGHVVNSYYMSNGINDW